jgi:glycosyltransferase involved in cell wall biosynthesis
MEKYLKSIAGPTIEFAGRVPEEGLSELYARSRAFLFAADEDFGIVPVEAQSFGRPVIAYGHGGSLETVRVNDPDGAEDTGLYFGQQSVEEVVRAIRKFEMVEHKFVPIRIQDHAQSFDSNVFEKKFSDFVDAALQNASGVDQKNLSLLPIAV